MSYWIYIENDNNEVFCENITSNVSGMINASFGFDDLHWVDVLNGKKCNQVNKAVKKALSKFLYNKKEIELLEASNGWGTYDQLLGFFVRFSQKINENPRYKILIH